MQLVEHDIDHKLEDRGSLAFVLRAADDILDLVPEGSRDEADKVLVKLPVRERSVSDLAQDFLKDETCRFSKLFFRFALVNGLDHHVDYLGTQRLRPRSLQDC